MMMMNTYEPMTAAFTRCRDGSRLKSSTYDDGSPSDSSDEQVDNTVRDQLLEVDFKDSRYTVEEVRVLLTILSN